MWLFFDRRPAISHSKGLTRERRGRAEATARPPGKIDRWISLHRPGHDEAGLIAPLSRYDGWFERPANAPAPHHTRPS